MAVAYYLTRVLESHHLTLSQWACHPVTEGRKWSGGRRGGGDAARTRIEPITSPSPPVPLPLGYHVSSSYSATSLVLQNTESKSEYCCYWYSWSGLTLQRPLAQNRPVSSFCSGDRFTATARLIVKLPARSELRPNWNIQVMASLPSGGVAVSLASCLLAGTSRQR